MVRALIIAVSMWDYLGATRVCAFQDHLRRRNVSMASFPAPGTPGSCLPWGRGAAVSQSLVQVGGEGSCLWAREQTAPWRPEHGIPSSPPNPDAWRLPAPLWRGPFDDDIGVMSCTQHASGHTDSLQESCARRSAGAGTACPCRIFELSNDDPGLVPRHRSDQVLPGHEVCAVDRICVYVRLKLLRRCRGSSGASSPVRPGTCPLISHCLSCPLGRARRQGEIENC